MRVVTDGFLSRLIRDDALLDEVTDSHWKNVELAPGESTGRHAWSDLIEVLHQGNQGRFWEIGQQFRATLPIANIESPAAFPADDILLLKALKRPAIEAVCLNRTGNPAFAGG